MNTSEAQAIDRISTGIEGLDKVLRGGLPRGRSTLIAGGAGTGKTVLALQTLVTGAKEGEEAGIFVTFEETATQLRTNAKALGWDLESLENDRLFFLEARLSPDTVRAGEFDFQGMLAGLGSKGTEMGATRIVFDGIDVLLDLLDDPVAERREMYRLKQWLEESDLTGILTFKGGVGSAGEPLKYGFMEYLVDTVLLLESRLVDRVSVRTVRVLKYRGSGYREGEFPLVIGEKGMEVVTFDRQLRHPRLSDRVSTGLDRLDTMLGGGYYRSSTVLVSGAAGSAKTTLAGLFAEAACKRGERVLFVSFDEAPHQIAENLASVSIDLSGFLGNELTVYSTRSESRSAEHHLVEVRRLIREIEPRHLVVDPISAFGNAGGQVAAVHAALRLLDFAKSEGITCVVTSLVPDGEISLARRPIQISTMSDTWIHLEYLVRDGERNRTLTVVKSRGMRHSNQVRELILGDDGVDLADVYVEGGEVLLGTSRWVREQELATDRHALEGVVERERRALELSRTETLSRISRLELALEEKEAQLRQLERAEEVREERLATRRAGIHDRRHGDGPTPPPPPAVAPPAGEG